MNLRVDSAGRGLSLSDRERGDRSFALRLGHRCSLSLSLDGSDVHSSI